MPPRQRGRFGPVHVFDPFGITGLAPAAFNPLDRIDPAGLDVAVNCMTLADALVHDAHNEQTDLLRQETVVFDTLSRALDAQGSVIMFAQHHVGRSLLTPDEVRMLPPDRQFLFLVGQRPVIAMKLRYYADCEFAERYDHA